MEVPPRAPILRSYGNPGGAIVGAIRWDAWYTSTSVADAMKASLGPDPYHWRSPWFSSVGLNTISFNASQSTMDAEIDLAVDAGLVYFAFGWYGASSEMRNGWNLFQSSTRKNNIKWCVLVGYGEFVTETTASMSTFVALLQQSNYLSYGARPVLYLMSQNESTDPTAQIAALRAAAQSAGLGNPYIVVLGDTAALSNAQKLSVGGDAISDYTYAPIADWASYRLLDQRVRSYWRDMVAVSEHVPLGVLGFNRSPRIVHPVPWEPSQQAGVGLNNVYGYPAGDELSDHIQALVDWTVGNSPSKLALIYAWNEHDEGGWLCPTYVDGVQQNAMHINSLKRVLKGQAPQLISQGSI